MLCYLSHYQLNKTAWDRCIYHSREGILYAYSWYLDVVAPNWEALVWVESLQTTDKYIAVMPLPIQKKYGISYIEQPLFVQQLGIFSTQKLSKAIFVEFLKAFRKRFKLVAGYPFNTTNYEDFGEEIFKQCALPYQINYTHHLDLTQSYQQIQKNYRRDTRYRLKKANSTTFWINESQKITDLWDLFYNHVVPKIDIEVSPLAAVWLEKTHNILEKKMLCELFFIYSGNTCRSGVLIAKSPTAHTTKWIYLFNAATGTPKDESRRWFLDFFIKNKSEIQSKENSTKKIIFDFESAQEKQVADFYASFGSEKKAFVVLRYNVLPTWIQFLQHKVWEIKQLLKRMKPRPRVGLL